MIDQKKFFNICKVMGIQEVTNQMGLSSNSTIYNWIKEERIPPLKWMAVNEFMEMILEKYGDKIEDRISKKQKKTIRKPRKTVPISS